MMNLEILKKKTQKAGKTLRGQGDLLLLLKDYTTTRQHKLLKNTMIKNKFVKTFNKQQKIRRGMENTGCRKFHQTPKFIGEIRF